jgi:aminoglycoside phosphotransferase
VLAWAAQAVAPGARITQAAGLREGGNPWLLRLERAGKGYRAVVKTGDPASARDRMQLRTQVAALALARDRGLPVPRVIAADLSGSQAGVLALVTSVLPGSSAIPRTMPAGRARQLGAAAAAIHAVALTPRPGLPRRTRPLADMDFAAWRRSAGTTPLLARAERQVSELPVPGGAAVLVHGDLWQGNTMWSAGVCTGVIYWDAAGAGHRPGYAAAGRGAVLRARRCRPDPRWLAASRGPGAGARRVLGRCRRADHGRRHGAVPAAAARPPPARS